MKFIIQFFLIISILTVANLTPTATVIAGANPSYSAKAAVDTMPFYANGDYDPAIPRPDDFFENHIGQWPLRYHELIDYLKAVEAASDRIAVEIHGETHEGRPLFNVFVSSPERLGNRIELKEDLDRLADPRLVANSAELDGLIAGLPAVAWLGYNIHGDEVSGTDAAIRLVYQLAADRTEATRDLLDKLFIIIDPCENPDGRERYLSMLETYKSHVPNYDARSMQHDGVWPWGRANHYLFDLNRDWILLTQPETKGKTKTILTWHPQLVVDAHEMGSNSNFLFSPPNEPINHNIPNNVLKWYKAFSRDQAAAFDERGWPYYTGEWYEQWYPGYGSSWPTYHGAVGILYEQAGTSGLSVKQRDEYILTFHEAINHQFTSSLANLTTAAGNREALLRDYHQARKNIIAEGEKSGLQYLIVPDGDRIKTRRFFESIISQGIIVERAKGDFTVPVCTDIYLDSHKSKNFPTGTYIINTAQPLGALIKGALEFDPRLSYDFLKKERREIEKFGDSKLYEVSTWSVPLAYDMDAYYTTSGFKIETETVTEVLSGEGRLANPEARFGYVIDMEGEKTFLALTRIYSEELIVYCATKPFTLEGHSYHPGALVLRVRGNSKNLPTIMKNIVNEIGIDIYGVNTGLSTDGSQLGAGTFRLLSEPRIALVTGTPMDFGSVGSLWFTIDRELELPHSLIAATGLGQANLAPFNVLVLPSAWGNSFADMAGPVAKKKLADWVADGGTLICTGQSAVWAADSSTGLSQTRLKRQALDKLDKYELGLSRERQAEAPEVDTLALWYPEKVKKTKKSEKAPKTDLKELEEIDKWQRKFRPGGVIMRADVDTEDWLAFGMKKRVPVMVYTRHALLANPPVKATARFADENDLRMSGLLWPEARSRWAATAYATHERKGGGQIVLFATDPNMRAYFHGTRKMLATAILYGPGMAGAYPPYGN
ncbi:MAG: hypothetical protein GY841_18460 [FCB group bacterium]|nr:hypothetical protein [FCB group bacterium]